MKQEPSLRTPQGKLEIGTVITSDQRDLIAAVQAAQFREEVIHMAGFSQTNAVGQLGHGSVMDGVHADEFRDIRVFDEGCIEERVEGHSIHSPAF